MKLMWASLLLALTASAQAPTPDYLGGVWPSGVRPPSAQIYASRVSPVPGEIKVQTTAYIHTLVPQGAAAFEWGLMSVLDNYSDGGENSPLYTKGVQRANGVTWGAVFESQSVTPNGAFYGAEIDYMGVRGARNWGSGLLMVMGRSDPSSPLRDPADTRTSHLDTAISVLPFWPDRGLVRLDYGLRFGMPCEVACLSLQGGSAVKFSDDPAVPVHRFDPQTGFVGYWNGRLCVWCVHATTGQVAQMRQF